MCARLARVRTQRGTAEVSTVRKTSTVQVTRFTCVTSDAAEPRALLTTTAQTSAAQPPSQYSTDVDVPTTPF